MVEDIDTHSLCQLQTIGTQGRLCVGWHPVCVPHFDNTQCVCHNLGTQCVCQLQTIGTQGRLCLEWHTVCVPHFEKTECMCHNLGTQCVPTTDYWHPGSSLLGLAHSVCAPFWEIRMCVSQFEKTVCVCGTQSRVWPAWGGEVQGGWDHIHPIVRWHELAERRWTGQVEGLVAAISRPFLELWVHLLNRPRRGEKLVFWATLDSNLEW